MLNWVRCFVEAVVVCFGKGGTVKPVKTSLGNLCHHNTQEGCYESHNIVGSVMNPIQQ